MENRQSLRIAHNLYTYYMIVCFSFFKNKIFDKRVMMTLIKYITSYIITSKIVIWGDSLISNLIYFKHLIRVVTLDFLFFFFHLDFPYEVLREIIDGEKHQQTHTPNM